MKKNMKKIGIASIMLVLVLLLGLAGWLIFGKRKTNVGVQEAANELGIEWYDEDEKEFTLTTADELFEFAKLANYYDFAGQTIKLGADIVVNEGNAEDWANKKNYPDRVWESVYGFAGTFDGQGHTISGIYCIGFLYTSNIFRLEKTDYVTAGLFRDTQKECVIKNFRLVNSFFDSDLNQGCGCISSYGGGTFDSIYVDAILTSQKNYIGGILGLAKADTKITNCWFDGEINVIGGYARPTGGIVGQVAEGKELTIEHCLMSGEMYNDLYQRGVNMGGILGLTKKGTAIINDCLVSGNLHNDWQIVGSAIGNVPAESTATLTHVYTVEEAWKTTIGHKTGTLNGTPVTYAREKLLGYGGYQWTSLDFDNYWAVVDGGTPVLKTFAEDALSLDGVARMVDLTWYDEAKDTFEIHDLADFYGFALLSYSHDFEGKTVKLCTDITINTGKASEWVKNAPEYDWISIGSSNLPFKGTFDGQMHTISGVYMVADKSYNGLFGMTANEAVIKNFSLKNSYFESSAASFGSIAGRGLGKYDTIYSNAIVRGSNANVGGIIGQVTGKGTLSVNNCWFDGSVTMTANDRACRKFGGILGVTFVETTLTNCLNTGTIDGSIYSCTNSDTSKHVQPYIGGMIGQIHPNGKATLSYCMNVGEIKHNKKATTSYAAIIGTASGKANISHVYATKESCERAMNGHITGQTIVYDEARLKGYGGYKWTTLNFDKYWAVVENDTSILRSFAKKKPSVSGVARMIDTSWYDDKASTYVLQDVADLYGLALLSYTNNFEGKTVKLGADITINEGNAADWANVAPENEWMNIGSSTLPFAGTFDGQMHTISGVYLTADKTYSGFFAKTSEKAVIKNVKLTNGYMSSDYDNFGSIVGLTAGGTFDTIYSDVIVSTAGNNVGGLIGRMQGDFDFVMKNCWFNGSVTNTGGTNCMGGLVGRIFESEGKARTITNCLNTGDVAATESTSRHIGGLVGHSNSKKLTISDAMNTGTLSYHKDITSSDLQTYGSVIGTSQAKATVADTFATTESCARTINGSVNGRVIAYNEDRIKGYGGYQWTTLDFDTSKGYWAVVLTDTPVLRSFAATVPEINVARMLDISWYNDKDTTFTLDTSAELFGFALLSANNNFEGKTILLGADIDIPNGGDAADWATSAPQYEWLSIGSNSRPFAGNFDGQMHNISGVYLKADAVYAGLFGRTSTKATVKNFSMTNSYFSSDYDNFGSIVGQADGGTFDTIYSDAIVDANGNNSGGLIGRMQGNANFVMNNCCFDGSITNKGGTNCLGGLIGRVFKASGYTRTITNCLNAGDVKAEVASSRHVGGLMGYVEAASLSYSYCLNTGNIEYHPEVSKDDIKTYGAAIGNQAGTPKKVGIFSITQSSGVKGADFNANVNQIKGTDVLSKFPKLFTSQDSEGKYKNYFAVVPGQTPILESFGHLVEPLKEYKTVEPKFLAINTTWYDGSDKYTLSETEQLYGFATFSNITNSPNGDNIAVDIQDAEVKLDANITINQGKPYGKDDVAGTADDWIPAYGWSSMFVGTYTDGDDTVRASFIGKFDGQGHKISGVYLNASADYQGLFGYTGTTAEICNLKLTDSYFQIPKNSSGSKFDNAGSVVGEAAGGTFDGIYSNAYIKSDGNNIGGLIGRVHNGNNFIMSNCWFAGEVTNTGATNSVGGLIGRMFTSSDNKTIKNCLNTGKITATSATTKYVGGIIGYSDVGKKMMIANCFNAGIIGEGRDANLVSQRYCSIVGYTSSTTNIVDTYAIAQTNVAYAYTHKTNNTLYSVDAKYTVSADAINGTDALISMPNLFMYVTNADTYANESHWAVVPGEAPVLTALAEGIKEKSLAIDASWYDTTKTTYTLMDASDLFGFAVLANMTDMQDVNNKKIQLGDNIAVPNSGNAEDWAITAPEYEWIPIGTSTLPFKGEFDGQGNNISGVYVNATKKEKGLFGYTYYDAIIKNFSLTNSYFYSTQAALGSITGRACGGTFESIYSDAVVKSANANLGGLIGQMQGGANFTMSNCWFNGKLTNTNSNSIGGLIGYIKGASGKTRNVTNCLNSGIVTTENSASKYVGGLVGYCDDSSLLTISNCLNTKPLKFDEGISTTDLYYGLVAGYLKSSPDVQTTYTISQSGVPYMNQAENTNCTVDATAIQGPDATGKMPELFVAQKPDGTYYWTTVQGKHPVLKTFEKFAATE